MKRLCWSGQQGVHFLGKTSANFLKQLFHPLVFPVRRTATVFPMGPLYPDFSSGFFHKSNLEPVTFLDAFLLQVEA